MTLALLVADIAATITTTANFTQYCTSQAAMTLALLVADIAATITATANFTQYCTYTSSHDACTPSGRYCCYYHCYSKLYTILYLHKQPRHWHFYWQILLLLSLLQQTLHNIVLTQALWHWHS